MKLILTRPEVSIKKYPTFSKDYRGRVDIFTEALRHQVKLFFNLVSGRPYGDCIEVFDFYVDLLQLVRLTDEHPKYKLEAEKEKITFEINLSTVEENTELFCGFYIGKKTGNIYMSENTKDTFIFSNILDWFSEYTYDLRYILKCIQLFKLSGKAKYIDSISEGRNSKSFLANLLYNNIKVVQKSFSPFVDILQKLYDMYECYTSLVYFLYDCNLRFSNPDYQVTMDKSNLTISSDDLEILKEVSSDFKFNTISVGESPKASTNYVDIKVSDETITEKFKLPLIASCKFARSTISTFRKPSSSPTTNRLREFMALDTFQSVFDDNPISMVFKSELESIFPELSKENITYLNKTINLSNQLMFQYNFSKTNFTSPQIYVNGYIVSGESLASSVLERFRYIHALLL